MNRFPFLSTYRYWILITGFVILIAGFLISVVSSVSAQLAVVSVNEIFSDINVQLGSGSSSSSSYVTVPIWGYMLAFSISYLIVIFFVFSTFMLAEIFKIIISAGDYLQDKRTQQRESNVAADVIAALYAPPEPTWYERATEWMLQLVNRGQEEYQRQRRRAAESQVALGSGSDLDLDDLLSEDNTLDDLLGDDDIIDVDPKEEAQRLFEAGMQAGRSRQYQQAVNYFNQALSYDPDHVKARQGLARAQQLASQ